MSPWFDLKLSSASNVTACQAAGTAPWVNLDMCLALKRTDQGYFLLAPMIWAVAIFMYFGVLFLVVAIEMYRRNNLLAAINATAVAEQQKRSYGTSENESRGECRDATQQQRQKGIVSSSELPAGDDSSHGGAGAAEPPARGAASPSAVHAPLRSPAAAFVATARQVNQNIVMVPTIEEEFEVIDKVALHEINTISSFATLSVRGTTALTVFTTVTSVTCMFLVAMRAVLLPGYGRVCGNAVVKLVGSALFFFTGLMPSDEMRMTHNGKRDFNQVFTGYVEYNSCGIRVITAFHMGGFFLFMLLTIVAFFLQGDALGFALGGLNVGLFVVFIASVVSQNNTEWIHRNVFMFLAELLLTCSIAFSSMLSEILLIENCLEAAFADAGYAVLAPFVGVAAAGVLVWRFQRRKRDPLKKGDSVIFEIQREPALRADEQ